LRRIGWRVLNVWEHQIQTFPERSLQRIASFLRR
jgi:very-short-patch-repair endonuclease